MKDRDVVDMIDRSVEEITRLRGQIAALAPKAHAYDTMTAILDLLPKPSQGYGEDIVWRLKRQADEIRNTPVPAGAPDPWPPASPLVAEAAAADPEFLGPTLEA